MRVMKRYLAAALLCAPLLAMVPAAQAETVDGSYTMNGLGSTCAEAHVRNRMQLAERARLQCVNRAGQVRVVNMVNQRYRTFSCTREGIRRHTAVGEFNFECR